MTDNINVFLMDGCGRCDQFATSQCKVRIWQDILLAVRSIVLKSELVEVMKWGQPTYTFNGKNVIILSALKDHVTLGFFKGVLLKDPKKLLHFAGPNSKEAKYIRINEMDQVKAWEGHIKEYIQEAIQLEKEGKKIKKEKSPLILPQELVEQFDKTVGLKAAFNRLTPGRQRSHVIHISQAKQSVTRQSRAEKCIPKILAGKGFLDR